MYQFDLQSIFMGPNEKNLELGDQIKNNKLFM